ncbi:MAG: hypothetical protein U9Q81_24390 [Pseudomonadota bacterium]|nr:hypothetical protein [Pseudomonadota bacterium]
MLKLTARNQIWIGLALVALMAVTRGQHFAALGQHLPDASLAVFFLAGLYLRPAWGFALLFAAALSIDVAAVTWGGVSSFCISPAYLLLVPAYGAMWAAGRWYGKRYRFAWSTLLPLSASLLAGATVAELLASGGFYLFSGRFADLSLAELGSRLVAYFPASLEALALYAVLAAIAHTAVVLVANARHRDLTAG